MCIVFLWSCLAMQTDGCTPLFAASSKGHALCVWTLVDRGAAVDQATVCGRKAAMQLGYNPWLGDGQLLCVSLLWMWSFVMLGRSISVDTHLWLCANNAAGQTEGATPLFIASQKGHVECVQALLILGAAVDRATVRCSGCVWQGFLIIYAVVSLHSCS